MSAPQSPGSPRAIRVFIADDHAVVRVGLRHVLSELGGFDVVGEATSGREVLNAPTLESWDVLILDLSLPKVSGPEVLRRLRAIRPTLPVVVVSMYPEDHYARPMLAAGAAFYVSKERPPAELIAVVRAAARGERQALPETAASRGGAEARGAADGRAPHEAFTRREHQIFMLLVDGLTGAEIAAQLDLHPSTVSNHVTQIRDKLGVRTIAEVIHYAHRAGLYRRPPE